MGTTRAGMNLIKKIVKEGHDLCGSGGVNDHVKLVTIFFGSNDCSPINNNITHRLVSLPEFSSNLHTMIDDLRAAGINNVLLITPPPRGYDPALTAPHAEAVVEVGKARSVPVADFFYVVIFCFIHLYNRSFTRWTLVHGHSLQAPTPTGGLLP